MILTSLSPEVLTAAAGDGGSAPPLLSLRLAHNALSSLEPLPQLAPQLTRLDASHNSLASPVALCCLSALPGLRELRLEGNPLAGRRDYHEAVAAMLPQLQILDGVALEGSEPPAGPSAKPPAPAACEGSSRSVQAQHATEICQQQQALPKGEHSGGEDLLPLMQQQEPLQQQTVIDCNVTPPQPGGAAQPAAEQVLQQWRAELRRAVLRRGAAEAQLAEARSAATRAEAALRCQLAGADARVQVRARAGWDVP